MKKMQLLGRVLLAAGALTLGVAMPAFTAETVVVRMFDTPAKGGSFYVPNPVKIKVGDTIKWVNKGETVHTATTDPSTAPDPGWASVPAGAETFDSGYVNGGEDFELHVQGARGLPLLLHAARKGRDERRNRRREIGRIHRLFRFKARALATREFGSLQGFRGRGE